MAAKAPFLNFLNLTLNMALFLNWRFSKLTEAFLNLTYISAIFQYGY